MNVKAEALDQHKVQLTIDVPAEVVVKGFKQAVARIANQVKIPGFRKGKAPRRIIEMHFGKEAVAGEAQDIVINQALNDAIMQEKLIAVTTPEVKQERFSEMEGAAFTATFFKQPKVKLGEYKGLSAKHVKPEISDDQVMAQIRQAAEQNARMEKAEEGTVLKKGDIAVIDFKGTVDGKAFEGGEGKTYPLEIGSKSFIPGIEDQLEGHKAGDDVTVSVSFPKDYFMDTLAGKEAEFAVHINDVKHKVIPVIDDAFAKSVSRHETLDELKESLKQQMQLRAFQQAEEAYHQSLINQAVANSEVDIPQEVKLNMEAQGMDFDKYLSNMGKSEEEFRQSYNKTAEQQVREGLVLAEIANVEKLEATNQDLNMEVYSMARQFNAEPKDVIKIIRDENRAGMLYNSVLRKKAAAFIYGAAVKEESKKEETAKKTESSAKEKKESPLAAKTVKELKAYAEEKGIALDSRAKKADIIATIEAAERK